ncbi:FAD-dependent oxidoreductase [Streptomyces sp. NPDC056149]|uniref:FAD-dependent oxidoreductase n=1 Tax=Streptomyces sp. NPDC056149 TaxID=3345728 RepID=UPI0035DE6DC8
MNYVSFDHRISPDCTPTGKGLLSLHLHPTWSRQRLDLDDTTITTDALVALRTALPSLADHVDAHREMTFIHRWQQAVLNRPPGGYKALAAFAQSLDPHSPIQLAGDYLSLTLTNAALATGERAAERIHTNLASV